MLSNHFLTDPMHPLLYSSKPCPRYICIRTKSMPRTYGRSYKRFTGATILTWRSSLICIHLMQTLTSVSPTMEDVNRDVVIPLAASTAAVGQATSWTWTDSTALVRFSHYTLVGNLWAVKKDSSTYYKQPF